MLVKYIFITDFRRQNFQQFIDLQIPVSKSLKQSLQEYTSQVHLQGQNKYHTQDYGLQQAFKGVVISMFPPVLMIQLKRFQYSFQLERNVKILDKFVYPQFFNFAKWSQNSQNQQYQLYGVLVHQGSKAESGHYYNYLKINNLWYKFNDELVQQVPHQKVFNYNFGGTIETIQFDSHQMKVNAAKTECKSTAYMLVYVKKSFKSSIFDVKSQYPEWLIQKDANKIYVQQERKNRKYYFHDINVINWNTLKGKPCQTFGFLTYDYILECEKQSFKIDKRFLISQWLEQYSKHLAQNQKLMIPEKQVQMIDIAEKQQNNVGLYAYYVTPQRQTLCGYFHKSHHSMQELLKNLNEPTLIIGPIQATKTQYCVIIKRFQFLGSDQNDVDFQFDDFLIVNKEITNIQILNILRNKYQGLQKMQVQSKNQHKQQQKQSYNFFIQDYKSGLIKLRQTNYFLPSQGPNKNHLLIIIAERITKKSLSQKLTFQKWYSNQKDIVFITLKNQKTNQISELKGISGSIKASQLRNIIFEQVLNKNPQYQSANNIVIKYKQKKTSKLYSQIINDPRLSQLVKYDSTIVYSYSVLSVQSRLNQTQIIFYYRFKNFKFSDQIKLIVKKGESQASVVKKLKNHEQIIQYLHSQGFKNSILLLFTKDRYTINDVVDNQGRILGKGDLQTVLKKQKNAVLTIEGYQKIFSQKLSNQGDSTQNVSLLIHHMIKTGQKIGNPIYLYVSKNILLLQLKQKIMEIIMNESYQWENKIYPCNIFKVKMILYGKDSKKAIDIAEIQQEGDKLKQIQRPKEEQANNQTQNQKNNCESQKQEIQAMQIQKSKQIVNIEEESNTVTLVNAKQNDKKICQKQIQPGQKQPQEKTILTFFPKTKQLKMSIVHNYLSKAIQPLKLNVE